MFQLTVPLLIALIFYILIPGWGAFHVRNRCRGFRNRIIRASLTPLLQYTEAPAAPADENTGFLGYYRFFGSLEAIQDDLIWLRNRHISVSADLKYCSVYSIPSFLNPSEPGDNARMDDIPADEMPQRFDWNKIFSLPEGTKMFIAGALYSAKGRVVFRNEKETPLTVILYDGEEESLLARAIRSGRQKNEYWNQFTPVSLSIGAFALFILAYSYLRNPFLHFYSIFSICLSLVPAIVLFPPGIFFYFIYKNLWRKSRVLRAERDLVKLPLRYFMNTGPGGFQPDRLKYGIQIKAPLPNGGEYACRILPGTEAPGSGAGIRYCSVAEKLLRRTGGTGEYYEFGTPADSGDSRMPLGPPADPLAEHVILPGNPGELAGECSRQARIFEFLSMASFFTGLIGNSILGFIILSLIIR
ncbi:MAG: hypothetical protein E4H36_00270 [Spirochaetales bacterium]|nr:MAG: hypothetical protein E4H36_00270 [Spirochaetales bacterium]